MTITMSTSNRTRVDNGVNVEALLGAREALDRAPESYSRILVTAARTQAAALG